MVEDGQGDGMPLPPPWCPRGSVCVLVMRHAVLTGQSKVTQDWRICLLPRGHSLVVSALCSGRAIPKVTVLSVSLLELA